MKTTYLLPYYYKKIGWVLLLVSIVLMAIMFTGFNMPFLNTTVFAISDTSLFQTQNTFAFIQNNIQDELISIFFILGAFFIGFSKRKEEDEYILRTRLESLVWATYLNYLILLLTIIFIYGLNFFHVLVINMFTTLVFFLIRFNWLLYKSKKELGDEK